MANFQRVVYPFTAIIGQEKMQEGLILNTINPRLGGVLIRGEKGTAKSTAVRALAALLPEIEVVAGCPYNCDPEDYNRLCHNCRERLARGERLPRVRRRVPVIDLPISATEDRLVGSLDFEYAIKHGRPRFEPGILARANRGIIYVDEVNLLDDHLVDVLLDAAAMGVNIVEREGISYTHPAEFILVGTMNPEEGELRPQLLDRFGLCVQIEGVHDPGQRVEIIKRRGDFEADPLRFLTQWVGEEERLREKILTARQLLRRVTIGEDLLALITRLSIEAYTAGHRADIIITAAARTIAALAGREEVTATDVLEAAELVLPHRVREAPSPPPEQSQPPETLEEPPQQEENSESTPEQAEAPPEQPRENNSQEWGPETRGQDTITEPEEGEHTPPSPQGQDVVFAAGQPFAVRRLTYERDCLLRKGSGRRSRTRTATRAGRYVRATAWRQNNDLAFDATLRAAAPYQVYREKYGMAIAIEKGDFRSKVREKRIGNFLLFVVDASGSMGAQQRMIATKGAIFSLLLDAYQKRDKIGLVAFKGKTAEVLLPPTNSVEMGYKLLQELPTGGRTPLAAGLLKAYEIIKAHFYKDPNLAPLLIIISDGRANVSIGEDKPLLEVRRVAEIIRDEARIKTLVVDVEKDGLVTFGLARELAGALGAEYYRLDDLKSDSLVQVVRFYA
ncbi:MAG: putative cobaltochelatase, partial [Firmicutes bacterium]|nr:putative cobaltochelatase [Bacillota bacterium]